MTGPETLEQIAERRQEARLALKCRVSVCSGLGCESVGGQAVLEKIRARMKEEGLGEASEVYPTCCRGLCQRGPIVEVQWTEDGKPRRHLYLDVDEAKAERIAQSHARDGKPAADLPSHADDPFFTKQTKIVLANAGEIDPEDIESCIAAGAYSALQKALTEMKPADVIQEVTQSGLRGRGGGGYPTGLKWSTVAKEQGARKFVVCNGDEGDPGAFMDRSVLEGDPHEVLEGMAIAAYAVGAEQGYVYVLGRGAVRGRP
jgi:bidirectional [NiFe] hydrogenase diaphorase subunit